MLERNGRVLIAGVTARALAVSAARAGYRVTTIDGFGDVDLQHVATEVRTLRRGDGTPWAPPLAVRAVRDVDVDGVAYTANFENYPAAVRQLAASRVLLGNSPDVLARVRQPVTLMRALERRGFAVPETRASAPMTPNGRRWLLKPRRSGGGHGTVAWRDGLVVGRDAYLQERITGVCGSVAFLADGRQAVVLGVSRQIVGDQALGARGFRYCGNIMGPAQQPLFAHEERLRETAAALASAVTEEFGLIGVNGIDFIARDGVPYPIEVNPRYSASMELIERGSGVSIFALHARACAGTLPRRTSMNARAWRGGVLGKAIVFARRTVQLGDTSALLDDWHADVPHTGERIAAGFPICTVFARARTAEACLAGLRARAAAVWAFAEERGNRRVSQGPTSRSRRDGAVRIARARGAA